MKEKLIRNLSATKSSAHIIRALVGGYVVYTCGSVVVSYFKTDEVSLLLLAGSLIVTLFGLSILALSLWAIAKGYSVEYQGKAPWAAYDDEAEDAEETEPGLLPPENGDVSETDK